MEGKTYSYNFKERSLESYDYDHDKFQNTNNLDNDSLKEEYEKYKNYLMVKKECPACHFIQGMIFTGIGFFCFVRMHHFRQTFSKSDFLKLFIIAAPSSSFGVYKFTYANYIFGVQSKIDQMNKFLGDN